MDDESDQQQLHAWAQLTRVQKALEKTIEHALKSAGFPPLVWYDVLLELSREKSGHLRHRDLHQRMLLEKYNLSRLIDRMATRGLVERIPSDEDARGSNIAITDRGRALQQNMWPVYRGVVTQYFKKRLSNSDTAALNDLLNNLK